MYIFTPPSPEVENFQMKIYYPCRGPNTGPAEPEADVLPSEPARQALLQVKLKQNMKNNKL